MQVHHNQGFDNDTEHLVVVGLVFASKTGDQGAHGITRRTGIPEIPHFVCFLYSSFFYLRFACARDLDSWSVCRERRIGSRACMPCSVPNPRNQAPDVRHIVNLFDRFALE